MKEYKPNVKNLKYIVEKAYFAATGDKDEKTKERLYAGVDALVKLYEENPNAFYAVAAASLTGGAQALRLKNNVISTLAHYLVGKSGVYNKDVYNKDNTQGGN